jgi:hypothetical protein
LRGFVRIFIDDSLNIVGLWQVKPLHQSKPSLLTSPLALTRLHLGDSRRLRAGPLSEKPEPEHAQHKSGGTTNHEHCGQLLMIENRYVDLMHGNTSNLVAFQMHHGHRTVDLIRHEADLVAGLHLIQPGRILTRTPWSLPACRWAAGHGQGELAGRLVHLLDEAIGHLGGNAAFFMPCMAV